MAFAGLASAAIVCRASTSAGIFNAETGAQFVKSGGSHIYVAIADAADIPRAIKVLFDRLWLEDYGWVVVGGSGQILERSLIDASVGLPERLVFEGAPVVLSPLAQDKKARKARVSEGSVIDTKAVLPDLTKAEQARLDDIKSRKRHAVRDEALVSRETSDLRLAKKIAAKGGAPLGLVLDHIRERHKGILLPEHPLIFDDANIGEITVADILLDPTAFLGETLADPLEGLDYGRCKAKVLGSIEDGLIIHSFAHGGAIYRLKMNAAMVDAIVAKAPKETVVSTFLAAISSAQLEPGDLERLKSEVVKVSGMGLRVLNRAIKERDERENAKKLQFQAEAKSFDLRIKFEAPDNDAELLATLRPIDEILSQANVSEPPFRNIDGRHCRVIERSPSGLRELGAKKAANAAKHELPAPPEPLIVVLDTPGVTMDVEKYIRLEVTSKGGNDAHSRDVRLQAAFANAYADWPDSKLPVVRGISTLPLVLPDRVVVSKNGLHKELGIIFRSQSSLLEKLVDREKFSLEFAERAFSFLTDNWLADVDTDETGKAIIVAKALTLIERHLLPARPAFFVTAGQRGGGKTTALNMVSAAVYGRPAAAANWSPSEEERRKSIFSYFSDGVSLLVWDNIPRGEAISCPTIEKALTSAELSDRVLGASRTATVPATTVMAFTGNNIAPKGDLASRSLVVRLNVSRADPENREFIHPDPIGWTIGNRRKILHALYAILLASRECPRQPKTRFKNWWTLIGHPIELVSGVDFVELFDRNDEADEEVGAATSLFTGLHALFGESKFTAAEVCDALNGNVNMWGQLTDTIEGNKLLAAESEALAKGSGLRSALEEAAGGKRFPPGPVNPQRVGKKLQALIDRTVLVENKLMKLRSHSDHDEKTYRIKLNGA
jgi:hypothetical protein